MNSFLTLFIAFSAIIIGLSVIAQTIQELYKYLTMSKSQSYSKAMNGYMGELFSKVLKSDTVKALRINAPIGLFANRAEKYIQPLDTDTFSKALDESLLTGQLKLCHKYLKQEVLLQANTPATLSLNWQNFLTKFGNLVVGSTASAGAPNVINFLLQCNHTITPDPKNIVVGSVGMNIPAPIVDAKQLLMLFESLFLEEKKGYVKNYEAFLKDFDFTYKRRNVRQTFFIGIVLCCVANLPIQKIYKSAARMDDKAAIDLLDETKKLYDAEQKKLNAPQSTTNLPTGNTPSNDASAADNKDAAVLKIKENIESINKTREMLIAGLQKDDELFDCKKAFDVLISKESFLYLFGCLCTAICLSFGAPIINDLAAVAVSLKTGVKK